MTCSGITEKRSLNGDAMKKPKSLETKLRSAIRLIWSRSKQRREILKAAIDPLIESYKAFKCPICKKFWPIEMAEVDHIEAVGALDVEKLTEYVKKMFYS